jgi:hypothetical protein
MDNPQYVGQRPEAVRVPTGWDRYVYTESEYKQIPEICYANSVTIVIDDNTGLVLRTCYSHTQDERD